MPAHAGGGHPIKAGARAAQAPWRITLWDLARPMRVPAVGVDQLVQLPALLRQRPRAERLLDHGTLPCGQDLGGLLPRPIGGLPGSRGGITRAHGHPVPAPLGRFPLHTRGIQARSSQAGALRHSPCVTLWDVRAFQGSVRDVCHFSRLGRCPAKLTLLDRNPS
jgi:hypothetical protein